MGRLLYQLSHQAHHKHLLFKNVRDVALLAAVLAAVPAAALHFDVPQTISRWRSDCLVSRDYAPHDITTFKYYETDKK